VTRQTPPLVFRAMQGVVAVAGQTGGGDEINPSAHILTDRGGGGRSERWW
jgi:hypothetical protein